MFPVQQHAPTWSSETSHPQPVSEFKHFKNRFFLTVSQLWSTLRWDPLWPPYPWPILPAWCWGRRQWPQLRPYQQLPPATLTSNVYQTHTLPCRTNSRVQPTSTLFWRARWSLCKGEQAKTATCSPEPASSTGRQVRRWGRLVIHIHTRTPLLLDPSCFNLTCIGMCVCLLLKCMCNICISRSGYIHTALSVGVSVHTSHRTELDQQLFTQIYIHGLPSWKMNKTWVHAHRVVNNSNIHNCIHLHKHS